MSATCIIIGGALWVSVGDTVAQVDTLSKTAGRETVVVQYINGTHDWVKIEHQHQLRQNGEEWLRECIVDGYTISPPPRYDDIDINEDAG